MRSQRRGQRTLAVEPDICKPALAGGSVESARIPPRKCAAGRPGRLALPNCRQQVWYGYCNEQDSRFRSVVACVKMTLALPQVCIHVMQPPLDDVAIHHLARVIEFTVMTCALLTTSAGRLWPFGVSGVSHAAQHNTR